MRLLVCGTRKRTRPWVREWLRKRMDQLAPAVVIEGGYYGVDTLARKVAESLGIRVETFTAQWRLYGRAAGPRRNQAMLESGVDYAIALPDKESKGTFDMVRRLEKAGVPIEIKSV